jgi:hypothetical protein
LIRNPVLLAGWCGPRPGEVAELRRKGVNVDCSVLTGSRAVIGGTPVRLLVRKVAVGDTSCSPRGSAFLLYRSSALASQREPAAKD